MDTSKVTVFGAGYVGLVTGICLATAGHHVTMCDVDEFKIDSLRAGNVPFHEPKLQGLLDEAVGRGAVSFVDPSAVDEFGEFVFVAVGTPSAAGGAVDLRFVRGVVKDLVTNAPPGTIVVMKSTVPPGTGQSLCDRLAQKGISYVSNPEFLREGRAVDDWLHADRIVLGGDARAVDRVAALYADLDAPILRADIGSVELIKYASNAFLATKISFANEIANLCDSVDADISLVMKGVGLDKRIGASFLKAGIGYGGSCFPKDTRALDFVSSINGHDFQLLKAVIDVNARQRLAPIRALRARCGDLSGLQIAVLGLTFKPDTDDTREAPAIEIIEMLLGEGAEVLAYDPVGRFELDSDMYRQVSSVEEATRGASAVILATEWESIVGAEWSGLVAGMLPPRFVYDGRNALDASAIKAAGAEYVGVGCR